MLRERTRIAPRPLTGNGAPRDVRESNGARTEAQRTATILVVEDSPRDSLPARLVIEHAWHLNVTACRPAEALSRANGASLVVISGLTNYRKLEPALRSDVPLLVLLHPGEDPSALATSPHTIDWLVSPLDRRDFVARLDRLILDAERRARSALEAPARAVPISARARSLLKRIEAVSPMAVPVLALAAWTHSLQGVQLKAMTDVGLLSVMPATFYVALGLLAIGIGDLLRRERLLTGALLAHLALVVVILQGTPAVLYDAPRYSWTWKHVGIIDYIQRHGTVDPGIKALDAYHNWPGFFAGAALLVELAGFGDALSVAKWAPLFFGLMNLGGVILLLKALTTHPRVVWLGAWLFVLGNWVGQEYFSPQAATYFLYLVLAASAIKALAAKEGESWRFFGAYLTEKRQRVALIIVLLSMLAAVASSHQLTPIVAVMVLLLLALARQARTIWLAVAGFLMVVGWGLFGAIEFIRRNLGPSIESIGAPVGNARSNLLDVSQASSGQALVTVMGRGLTVLLVGAAAIGLVRRWRRGHRDYPAIVLMLTPAALAVITSYDGEIIFRIHLFAMPALALFAAYAIMPAGTRLRTRTSRSASALLTLVLLTGMLFASLGKERQNFMAPGEVAAAKFIYETSPRGTLLIEGARNYPGKFQNYERFVYVPISAEPADTHRRLMANPAEVLSTWMSDDEYPATYLVLTRSQKAEWDALGSQPAGLLQRIETELRASRSFSTVLSNDDAVVFKWRSSDGDLRP